MRYRILGHTGLKVSELCLGTLTFGFASRTNPLATVDRADAVKHIRLAWERGINFFDTADKYSYGEAEIVLGHALKKLGLARDELVLASKVRGPMSEAAKQGTGDVNNVGLSRKHILSACEASLRRLGTDHLDLYQVHGWDSQTPIEETLAALEWLVQQGKVRYVGVSNWTARHIVKANALAEKRAWTRFVSLQAYYSLVGRDVEHELVPLCEEDKLGLLVWSPLAGGLLTAKYLAGVTPAGARRARSAFPPVDEKVARSALCALQTLAEQRNVSIASLALAWVLHRPAVTSVILGASRLEQLTENLEAANLTLSPEELDTLSKATAPQPLYPQWMIERQRRGR